MAGLICLSGGARGGGLIWYEAPDWTKHNIDTSRNFSTDIEVADINGAGKPDVVAIVWPRGLVWYRNPDWTPHMIANDVVVHDIEVADFDGDGKPDVIGRNQNLGKGASGATLFLFRQESPDRWSRHSFLIPDGEGLKAADIDGDGDLDIVVNPTAKHAGEFVIDPTGISLSA